MKGILGPHRNITSYYMFYLNTCLSFLSFNLEYQIFQTKYSAKACVCLRLLSFACKWYKIYGILNLVPLSKFKAKLIYSLLQTYWKGQWTAAREVFSDLGLIIIIIIIITGFDIALFQLRLKRFTVYDYPVHRIKNSALTVHVLHSLGSIPASCHFTSVHMPIRIPPGPHWLLKWSFVRAPS